jgi:hypothetical protein
VGGHEEGGKRAHQRCGGGVRAMTISFHHLDEGDNSSDWKLRGGGGKCVLFCSNRVVCLMGDTI